MPHQFKRPCIDCGKVSPAGMSRCDECQTAWVAKRERKPKPESARRKARKQTLYGGQYRKMAKFIRDTATHCHICGDGVRPNDPFEADHVVPGDPTSELRPAHRSCNRIKSNKQIRNTTSGQRNTTPHVGRHTPWVASRDGD